MAAGIADLGNGLGYIYKTKFNGSTIVGVERNTNQGAQAMIQNGVGSAPIAAQRSAFATITVSASGGIGSITNVDVLGVNQIGAPIVVTSANVNTVALQIVSAINSYSAPGFAFTANKPYANFAIIYIYSAPANGTIINGNTPIVTATDPGLQFLTTSFENGSNDAGVIDDQFGYRFFLYANPLALPDTLDPAAIEITKYLILRGSNSGIITISKILQTGGVINQIDRACDTTQIILDTGGPASAVCGFIETVDFVEGDTLRIRNAVPSRVTTIEDASVNTSSPTPNIYLSNQSPFPLTNFNSITLQYRYDPVLGPIWIETGRSISNSPITITYAQFSADATSGQLIPGARYFITDLSTGVYVYAIDSISYEQNGVLRRYIPANYTQCWRSNMAAPVINQNYRYYQRNYKSLTGLVGTAPDTDAVNWQLVPYTTPGAYLIRYNSILLNEPALMGLWPIIQEEDGNGNCVIQSYQHFTSSGVNAFNCFCWNQGALLLNYTGNYVCNAVFDVANSDGNVYENTVTSGSVFNNNILDASSSIAQNTFENGSIITGNNFRSLIGNYVNYGLIQNNFSGANKAPNIEYNNLNQGYIISNWATGNGAYIRNNNINIGSAIQLNAFNAFGIITNNTLTETSTIQGCVLLSNTGAPGHIGTNNMHNCTITYIQYAPADITSIRRSTFNNGTYNFNSVVGGNVITDSVFNNCTFSNWQIFGANQSYFDNCVITAQLDCQFFNSKITNWISASPFVNSTGGIYSADISVGAYSNYAEQLDLNDPLIYAANVLTVPYNSQLAGIIYLIDSSGAASKTIDQIVSLPNFADVKFYNATSGSTAITFNVTAPGAWTGSEILGAANFTLNGHATGVSDYMAMNKYQGAANMITTAINF